MKDVLIKGHNQLQVALYLPLNKHKVMALTINSFSASPTPFTTYNQIGNNKSGPLTIRRKTH